MTQDFNRLRRDSPSRTAWDDLGEVAFAGDDGGAVRHEREVPARGEFFDETKIERMNIDPALVEPMKNVMQRIGSYLKEHDYLSDRDYAAYFNRYLYNEDPQKNLKITVSGEPGVIGADGFYSFGIPASSIHLDENLPASKQESTLCHEMIHFLVMNGLYEGGKASGDEGIWRGGFINEALTEMLTQEIYPESRAYQPQTELMRFANTLSGNSNNYRLFLQGHIDAKQTSAAWNNFRTFADRYQQKYAKKGYSMMTAKKDEDYRNAQNCLIDLYIKPNLVRNFHDYERDLDLLSEAPVEVTNLDQRVENLEKSLVHSLPLRGIEAQKFARQQLTAFHENHQALAMYDNQDVYEQEVLGQKVAITPDFRFASDRIPGYMYGVAPNPDTGEYTFSVRKGEQMEKFTLSLDTDFTARRKELVAKQTQIRQIFNSPMADDLRAIERAEMGSTVTRYALPQVENLRKFNVWLESDSGTVKPSENYVSLGTVRDVPVLNFEGLTSTEREAGLIVQSPTGVTIGQGQVYSTITTESLNKIARSTYASRLHAKLQEHQIAGIIAQYQQNHDTDDIDEEELQDEAVDWFARTVYEGLPYEEKNQLWHDIIEARPKFVVYGEGADAKVATLFGKAAFAGSSTILHTTDRSGLYDQLSQDVLA